MIKRHSITRFMAAAVATAMLAASCADKPNAPLRSEPAAKSEHEGHDAQSVALDLSTDREIMAAVTMGGDNPFWGYIDKQGQWGIPPRTNSTGTWRNRDGVWEFVRAHPRFDAVSPFTDGLAAARDSETGYFGFIDTSGAWAIQPFLNWRPLEPGGQLSTWFEPVRFGMGLAPGYDSETGYFGFIDTSGAWAIQPQFSGVSGPFREGLAPVNSRVNHFCGYVSQRGSWVIEPQYLGCGGFYDGLAAVQLVQQTAQGTLALWGYIDTSGEWVIDPLFYAAHRFREGLAWVALDNEHGAYIDTGGQFVIGPDHAPACAPEECQFSDGRAARQDDAGLWGYIDKSGAWAIDPQFTWAGAFSEGLAVAQTFGSLYGYIDTQGEWVITPQYEHALPFTSTTP